MTTIGKICKWTVLILLGVLILGVVFLWLFFPVDKTKQYAIEKGTQLLEREISIESASVSFWGGIGIQLDNIVIKNPKGFDSDIFLSAKTLDVKLRIFPLISGDIAIDRLILKEPDIRLYKKQNGENNFSFSHLEKETPSEIVKHTSPETKAAAAIVTFDNIEFQNASLFYKDDSSKTKVAFVGLDLHSTLTHPYDNQYVSSGNISVNNLRVENNLKLPQVNLSLKYQAEFNPLEKSITISSANFNINGIPISITGELENIFSDLSAKINLQSEQAEIEKFKAFVPLEKKNLIDTYNIDGSLNLDLDIEYSISKFLYFGTILLKNVSASHNDIDGKFLCKEALLDIKNDNLRFNIKDGEFDGKPLKGYVTIDNFDDPFINGAFAGTINLKYVEPFLPAEGNHKLAGVADFDLKASGRLHDVSNIKIHGDIRSKNVSYNSDFMPEPLDSLTLEANFDNETITLKNLTATTQSGSFILDGRVSYLMQYFLADSNSKQSINPTIDAKLSGNLQLSLLNKILPPKGNPNLTGDLQVDLQLSGSVNDLSLFKPFGKVIIKNGSYSDDLLPEKVTNFNAQMTVLPDTIIVHKFQTEFETSDASFQGKLIDPFPFLLPIKNLNREKIKKPLFVFTFKSHRFDMDKLFPEVVPGVGEENKTASLDSVSTIILPDIDGRGTFSFDTLIYSKVELTSLKGKVNIKDKKIECYDVNGNVYSGKIEGSTTIDITDFNNPQYVGTFNAIQIEVNDFANRFSKLHNIIFGKVNMDGTYSAVGWEPEQFLNSLTMNSTSSIRQGKVRLLDYIILKSNKYLKKFIPALQKEQSIQNLFTNIIVKDGKVLFDNLKTKFGEIGDLEFSGFYRFDNEISYNGKLKLSQELTKEITSELTNGATSQNNLLGDITKLLTKKTTIGQIVLHPTISGTIDNPKFSLGIPSILK